MSARGGMRVAVVHWGRSGAGPVFALELARALQEDGCPVVLSFALHAELSDRLEALGVPSFGVRTYRDRRGAVLGLPRLLLTALRLDRFLRRHRVDVVVIAMEHLWQGVVAPVFRRGGRRVLLCVHDATMHPGDFSLIEQQMRRVQRRAADGAMVFSRAVGDALVDLGAFPVARVYETVHAAFRVAPDRVAVRSSPSDRPAVVGFFGRLSAYKGLDLGASAVAELRARGTRVRFRVVGSGPADELPTLDHEDDEVQNRWVGPDEVPDVVGAFDLALLPYTEASQSGVLAYTTALGVPAVVTPVGGLVEQAAVSGSVVVAAAMTPSALADAMEVVLSDPEGARALSEAGIAAAAGPLSWARVARDVRDAAADLGGSPR